MKKLGIILAAGKQSRINSLIPKALFHHNGEFLLEKNIQVMKKYVDKIYVIIDEDKLSFYPKEKDREYILINPGGGTGHSLYNALIKCNQIISNRFDKEYIIKWSDAFHDDYFYEELFKYDVSNYLSKVLISKIKNPYVEFIMTENICQKILFSKNGDICSKEGYQDASIFSFNGKSLYLLLTIFVSQYYNFQIKGIQYNTTNQEFNLLDLYNISPSLTKTTKWIYIDRLPKSFNTIEEYEENFDIS